MMSKDVKWKEFDEKPDQSSMELEGLRQQEKLKGPDIEFDCVVCMLSGVHIH